MFHSRFPSGCKCYSQRLSETYNFMLVRSEAREAEAGARLVQTVRAHRDWVAGVGQVRGQLSVLS